METTWDIGKLRTAIRSQQVSFPSQVPVFERLHRPDIQWRLVLLYFVRGWSGERIASRYGITVTRVHQLIRQWTARAVMLGYVDRIPSEQDCIFDGPPAVVRANLSLT